MPIYFSSATVQSYENKEKSMDLFYNPIIIFDGIGFSEIEKLENIIFTIESENIAVQTFDIQMVSKASIKEQENRCYLEFRLSKKGVPFCYDNYDCTIAFQGQLNERTIGCETLGVVKTKWTKGLV